MKILLLFISIIPVLLLGYYIYQKDREKEPKPLLLVLFCSGLLSAFLVKTVNVLIAIFFPDFYLATQYYKFNFFELFILIFLEIALVEELSKWLMIRLIGYSSNAFDQQYDIIVYSVFVALGFAMIENIFYVLNGGFGLGIYRAVFSVPGHVTFGVFMGYYLGIAKQQEVKNKVKYRVSMLKSVLVPALFHSLYNYLLMLENIFYLFLFLVFIIVLFFSAYLKIDQISKED